MRNVFVMLAAAMAVMMTGCRPQYQGEVVQENYFHKYGVPIEKEDWVRNGCNGSVTDLRKDGVTCTRSYEEGVLQGKTTYTFSNSSTIHIVETYEKGELLSRVENYLSGVPMKEEVYQEGFVVQASRWYEDGTPSASEAYEGGFLVEGEYKTPLNTLESKVEDGEGIRVVRGSHGELLSKDTIKEREMVEKVTFFENGEPSAVVPYEHGYIHGIRTTFLPGGLPHTREEWVHGKQEGITTVFQNGEKASEITYVNNEKHGREQRYHDGKYVVEEVSWRHGIQHGPRTLLSEEGTPLNTEWFHEGELVNRATFERMNVR